MRIGLIAAQRRTADGALRADLPLAGGSLLAWQATTLQALGVQRVICLTDGPSASTLGTQHALEAGGAAFHAINGFTALPALIRAEDDLVVVADGLVADPNVVRAVLGGEGPMQRMVATLPGDHPLAVAYPEDFERIDAARHWAGVLVMRGASVQRLADFPPDADAVSLLLRLALQAGTPCRELTPRELVPESWLLAESAAVTENHEAALIARAAPSADWRAPIEALAARLVKALAPRGLPKGTLIANILTAVLLIGGVVTAAFGTAAAGLALAALGAFAAQMARGFALLGSRLRHDTTRSRNPQMLRVAVDAGAAVTMWFALAPWPMWEPLAALGPVSIALARLAASGGDGFLPVAAGDRAALLLVLSLGAALGQLPEATACLALGLIAALLLRRTATSSNAALTM